LIDDLDGRTDLLGESCGDVHVDAAIFAASRPNISKVWVGGRHIA
jgi:hypothetical protein